MGRGWRRLSAAALAIKGAEGGNNDGLIGGRGITGSPHTVYVHTTATCSATYERSESVYCNGRRGDTLHSVWQLPKKATPRGGIGPCTRCTT